MGKENAAVTHLMSDKRRFADLFNGIVFQGKQAIQPQDLESIESESDILIIDKNQKKSNYQRHRDIVMRWKNKMNLSILACENQAKVHYAMPVRNMLYDSLSYTNQTKQLWESRRQKGEKPDSSEFLSHFFKDDYLIPVITLVFYHGTESWDASTDLYSMFSSDDNLMQNNLVQKYIPNYHINLIDANNLNDLNRFQTDLQQIFGVLQCRKNKQKLNDYMKQNESYFKNVDIDTCYALSEILNYKGFMKKAAALAEGKETVDMCQALEELYQDGVNQGLSQGISRGISQGIACFIEAVQEFGHTKEETLTKLMEKFNLERSTAIEHMEKYWKIVS